MRWFFGQSMLFLCVVRYDLVDFCNFCSKLTVLGPDLAYLVHWENTPNICVISYNVEYMQYIFLQSKPHTEHCKMFPYGCFKLVDDFFKFSFFGPTQDLFKVAFSFHAFVVIEGS